MLSKLPCVAYSLSALALVVAVFLATEDVPRVPIDRPSGSEVIAGDADPVADAEPPAAAAPRKSSDAAENGKRTAPVPDREGVLAGLVAAWYLSTR